MSKATPRCDVTLIQSYGDDFLQVYPIQITGSCLPEDMGETGVVMADTLYPSNGLGDMLIGLMNESLTDMPDKINRRIQ